jgi:hypothetical protein
MVLASGVQRQEPTPGIDRYRAGLQIRFRGTSALRLTHRIRPRICTAAMTRRTWETAFLAHLGSRPLLGGLHRVRLETRAQRAYLDCLYTRTFSVSCLSRKVSAVWNAMPDRGASGRPPSREGRPPDT